VRREPKRGGGARGGRGTCTRWSGVTACKGNGKGARGTMDHCDRERKGGGGSDAGGATWRGGGQGA
jgi:hypothetical protein